MMMKMEKLIDLSLTPRLRCLTQRERERERERERGRERERERGEDAVFIKYFFSGFF